jgi:hypothetical protein
MARITASKGSDTGGNTEVQITPSSVPHQTNDFICVFGVINTTGHTLSAAGWNRQEFVPSSSSSGVLCSCALFTKRAASSSESMPTIVTDGTANEMAAMVVIVRGVAGAGSEIVASISGEETTNSTDFSTPSMNTTGSDSALIIHFIASENDTSMIQFSPPISQKDLHVDGDVLALTCASFTQVTASSTTPSHTAYCGSSQTQITYCSIAIADSGTTAEPCVDPSTTIFELVHPMCSTASSAFLTSGVSNPISKFGSDTVNGLAPTYEEIQVRSSIGNGKALETSSIGLVMSSFSDRGVFYVGETGLTTAVNLTNTILNMTCASLSGPTFGVTYDVSGMFIGLSDGTNLALWKIAASDTVVSPSGGPFHVAIDTSTTPYYEKGTIDFTAINGIILGATAELNTHSFECGPIFKVKTDSNACIPIIGGSTLRPANFGVLIPVSDTGACGFAQNQRGYVSGQYLTAGSILIGNGTDKTIFKATNQNLSFTKSYDESALFVVHNIPEGKNQLRLKASASCDFDMGGIVVDFNNRHKFIVDPATNVSASYNFGDFVCLNSKVTLQGIGSEIYAGASFSGCDEIILNGFVSGNSLGALTISTCIEAQAVTVTTEDEFNALHNVTFTKNSALSIKITGNHGGDSWTATGMKTSGGQGSYDIEYTGTGTLEIVVDFGSGFTQARSQATAGTLTISAPSNTFSINADLSALIRRFVGAGDSQDVVDSATATTLEYDYTNTDVIDIEVLKQGYVLVNRQNVTPVNGPFDIELDPDEAYNSGHALNIDTEYAYVRGTKVLTFNSDQQARNVYSSLSDEIRLDSAYFNTKLLMTAIGPTRFDLTAGMTVADMQYWKGAGSQVYNSADAVNPTEKWFFVKSGGNITGSTTHFRQTDSGASTALTLTNNVVDEAFQYYRDDNYDGDTSDTDEYNYNDYMVIKSFLSGSKQSRVDLLVSQGISEIESYAYAVSLANASHSYSGTDPGISAQITMVAGGTYGGKVFAYEIIDGGTNSGADIADQFNYDAAANPNALIPGGTGLRYFEMPDGIIYNATGQETEVGYREGSTPTQVGFYVSRSSADHPDFSRFQADDGTYYTPTVTANITVTGLVDAGAQANDRLQILNVTALTASAWQASNTYATGSMVLRTSGIGTEGIAGLYMRATTGGTSNDTEPTWDTTVGNTSSDTNGAGAGNVVWTTYGVLFYDSDPAGTGYSATYVDGEEIATGDAYEIKFAEMDEDTTFKIGRATGVATVAGFTVAMELTADSVFASLALDGSDYEATFSPDFTNDYIVLDANIDFSGASAFAYYAYTLTTAEGMYKFWDGVTAIDTGNFRINTANLDLYFDESGGFVKQTDSVRIFRDDGTRPAIDPTTGGNGIEINWRNPVYVTEVNTGSAVNQTTVQAALTAQGYTPARAPELDMLSGIEGGMDHQEVMRLLLAAAAGKLSGAEGTTVSIRDQADSKNRIVATVDENGNRTAVAVDAT